MASMAMIDVPEPALAAFCYRHRIRKLALFGSVLRPDFSPDSDVDVLVAFAPEVVYSFGHLTTMQRELESLFDRPVDLIDNEAVQESPNYIRRRAILESAQVIYTQ